MTINIIQTITKTLTEDRQEISSRTTEAYVLTPDTGKMLRNKLTGETYTYKICLYQKLKIKNYEEIDIPEEKEN